VPLGEYVVSVGRQRLHDRAGRPNVSRRHAEIRPVGDGFVVVDLGSTNGTKVNDAACGEHQLETATRSASATP
jgi:pSer/pThr/pTyr-binding forkhead associated (FHA) protein